MSPSIHKLKKRIKLAEEYKKEAYKEKKIEDVYKRVLYHDDYIDHCYFQIKKKKIIRIIPFILIGLLLFFYIGFEPDITGLVPYEENVTENITEVNITNVIEFENVTLNVTEVNITGLEFNITENITLENITEQNVTVENITEITNITEEINITLPEININLEYKSNTLFDVDDNGIANLTDIIDFTVENTLFNFDYGDKLCTRYSIESLDNLSTSFVCYGNEECCNFVELIPILDEWNDSLNVYVKRYDAGLDNIVSAQVLFYNITDIYYSEWQNLTAKFMEEVNITVPINITEINITNITEIVNVTIINETIKQFGAVIGKPVKWIKKVKYSNLTKASITIPKEVINFSVRKIIKNKKFEINESKIKIKKDNIIKTIGEFELDKITGYTVRISEGTGLLSRLLNWLFNNFNSITGYAIVDVKGEEEAEIIIEEEVEEIEIEYYTDAPVAVEESTASGKKIIVSAVLNYTDILTFTSIPDIPESAIKLYWYASEEDYKKYIDEDYSIKNISKIKVDITYEDFGVSFLDENENGLIDKIYWITPHTSEQEFEISLTILTLKSHPQLGSNWTVSFNTTGVANLTITAVQGTSFGVDLVFKEMRCDDVIVDADYDGNRVFVEDYSCLGIGRHEVTVLTFGSHYQEFNFGGITAIAENAVTGCSNGNCIDDNSTDWEAGTLYQTNQTNGNITLEPNELPDNQGVVTDSTGRVLNMSGNVLLLHLNDNDSLDTSGNGNDGIMNGGLDCTGDGGKLNDGCDFDGANKHINFGLDKFSDADLVKGTIGFWFNPDGNTGLDYIVNFENRIYISITDGGIYALLNHVGGNSVLSLPASNESWQYLALTWDGSDLILYVDENSNTTPAGNPLLDAVNRNQVIASQHDGSGDEFDGSVDEFALWNRTLSSAEITDIYNAQKDGYYHNEGNFTSQIFNAGSVVTWDNISWSKHYGELPDNQEVDEISFKANMSGNVLLLHLNDNDSSDSSGLGNDGVVSEAVYNSSGKLNGAYTFDGTDDSINISDDNSLDITEKITIMAWIYPTAFSAGVNHLVGHRDSSNNNYNFISSDNSNCGDDGMSYYGGKATVACSDSPSVLNTWQHIAMTLDNSTTNITFYRNGILVKSAIDANAILGSGLGSDLYIGRVGMASNEFEGNVDEVAIWNRTLSSTEITDIYNRQKDNFTLKFQVRTTDSGGSTGDWVGYDNSSSTYFTAGGNVSGLIGNLSGNLKGQYLQYKSFFETTNTTLTPYLEWFNVSYRKTSTPPTITLDNPSNGSQMFVGDFINFTISDDMGDTDEVWYSRDSGSNNYTLASSGSKYFLNTTGWQYVETDVYVYVNDTLGNVNYTIFRFNITGLNISIDSLSSTTASSTVYVSGHVNLSNGTNVSNNLIYVWVNGSLQDKPNADGTFVDDFVANWSSGTLWQTNYTENITMDLNPSNLTYLSNYSKDGNPCGLTQAANFYVDTANQLVYATGFYIVQSLVVINISDPRNPNLVKCINGINGAFDVEVIDDYAYVVERYGDQLTLLNITANPITEDYNYYDAIRPDSIEQPNHLEIVGDLAYVNSEVDDSITVINISNPASLTAVGDYNDTEPPYSIEQPGTFKIVGDLLYVVSQADDSLTILNISDPTNIVGVGNYTDSISPYSIDGPLDLTVVGDLAYVTSGTDDELTILNVSNVSSITAVGSYVSAALMNNPIGVDIDGDYAFVAAWTSECIVVLDISDPTNPSYNGRLCTSAQNPILNPRYVKVIGDKVYTDAWNNPGLVILQMGYHIKGTYVSGVFDARSPAIWNNLTFSMNIPSGTNITFNVTSCDDINCNGESFSAGHFEGGSGTGDFILNTTITPTNQYFQYKIILEGNTSLSPYLEWVNVSYTEVYETDSGGNYNASVTAPSLVGTYEVVVNLSYSGVDFRNNVSLKVVEYNNPSIILVNQTDNTQIFYSKEIYWNITDDVAINNVWYSKDSGSTNTTPYNVSTIYELNTTNWQFTKTDIYVWANDTYGNINETRFTFNITGLNISIYSLSSVSPSATFTVSGHVNLSNGTNVDSIIVYIWMNNSLNGTNLTDSNGDYSNNSIVSPSLVGTYEVAVNLTYNNIDFRNNVSLTVVSGDSTPPYFSNNKTNFTTLKVNENAEFSIVVNDSNSNLDSVIFSIKNSSSDSWENISKNVYSGIDGINATFNLTISSVNNNVFEWKFYANDSNGYMNESDRYNITISDTYVTWTNNGTNFTSIRKTDNGMFNITVIDADGLDRCMFSLKNDSSASWYNYSALDVSGTSFDLRYNISISSNRSQTLSWRYYCNDSSGTMYNSSVNNITISDYTAVFSQNGTNATSIRKTDNMMFNITARDEDQLAMYIFSLKNSSSDSWYNYSAVSIWGNTSYFINTTHSISSNVSQTLQWKYYVNDTNGTMYESKVHSFVVSDYYATWSRNGTNFTSIKTNQNGMFNITVTDADRLDRCIFSLKNSSLDDWYNYSALDVSGSSYDLRYNITISTKYNYSLSWRYYCNDTFGVMYNSSIYNITISDTAPALPSWLGPTPSNGSSFNVNKTFNWTATDADNNVLYYYLYIGQSNPPDTHVVNNLTYSNWTSNFTSEGIYYYRLLVSDLTLNSSFTETRTITYDLTQPNISLISQNNSDVSDPTPTISFNVTDNLASTLNYTIHINGSGVDSRGEVNNGSTSNVELSKQLSLGTHKIVIEVADQVGNKANSSELFISVTSSIVYLNYPDDNEYLNYQTVNFTFNVTDASYPTLNCSLYIDNVYNQSDASTPINTKTQFFVTLAEGNYTWNVSCRNQEGIEGQDSRAFQIDVTSPDITWVIPKDDGSSIFNDTFIQNVTFNDSSLFQFECIIYSDSALTNAVWALSRNITGTSYTKTDSVSVSNLTDSTYYERCSVSDRE